VAGADDVDRVAEALKEARHWPAALALLESEANALEGEAAEAARAELERARDAYEQARANAERGRIGPDGVIRFGDQAPRLVGMAHRSRAAVFDP
jgi:hypothetical protein